MCISNYIAPLKKLLRNFTENSWENIFFRDVNARAKSKWWF